ncbi:MAG: hypothetical protein LBQ30_05945, partial [Treponema sp.]|nr:hypothetical protein [Treponema sp.]
MKSNITDNQSAMIKGAHGYIQGYNGIAIADSAKGVLVHSQYYICGYPRRILTTDHTENTDCLFEIPSSSVMSVS